MLLPGRGHQHGLALALASLKRDAGVAKRPCVEQRFEIGQRFIDHHRAQLGCLVHDVGAVSLQVASGRLLDIFDAFKTARGLLFHLAKKGE